MKSFEMLTKLAIDLDKAIQNSLDNKDPEMVMLLMDIRRSLGDLCLDVTDMHKMLKGIVGSVAFGYKESDQDDQN